MIKNRHDEFPNDEVSPNVYNMLRDARMSVRMAKRRLKYLAKQEREVVRLRKQAEKLHAKLATAEKEATDRLLKF